MKKTLLLALMAFTLTEMSCQEKKSGKEKSTAVAQPDPVNQTIGVDAFEKKLNDLKNVQLIDVRTPEEFGDGHLDKAMNIDWSDASFADQAAKLDKNKPVMVYCLGGGRSAAAAEKLQLMGFITVYNMDGGYMKWTAANKPVVAGPASGERVGMTLEEYNKRIVSDKEFVLVDFNAKWCAPCQKMMPMLKKITEERKDKLTFITIDADEHKSLLQDKAIDAIPYFEVYKNGKLLWKLHGYMDEATFIRESGL